MSDTTGHKPISDEVLEKVAEIWYHRVDSRLGLKRFHELHETVKRNMIADIKVIVELVRELED